MLDRLYKYANSRKMVTIDPNIDQLQPVDVVDDNGLKCRVSKYVKTCFNDKNKQFNARDFDIENILDSGATILLKEVSFNNSDSASFASNIDKVASEFDKSLQNNQPKNPE